MRKLLIIFILWLGGVISAAAIPVEFKGERPTGFKQLSSLVQRLSRTNYSEDIVIDSVKIWLVDNGYFEAEVSPAGPGLMVDAGQQTRLHRLVLRVDSLMTDELNLPFTALECQAALEQRLISYQKEGYYYARLVVDSVTKRDYSAALYASLNLGPLLRTSGSRFEGLSFTSPELVRRLIEFPPDRVVTRSLLRQGEQLASSIPFLNFVPPLEVLPRPGYTSARLKYQFRERKRFSIFGGAGYVPDLSDGGGGMVWQVRARGTNFFGEGRMVNLESQRRERGRQMLQIGYQQPNFWLGVGSFEFEVATRDFRESFSEFATSIGLSTRVGQGGGGGTTAGVRLGLKRVELAGTESGFTRYEASLNLKRSTLFDSFNPRRGFELASSIGYAHRRYSSSDKVAPAAPNRETVFNDTRAELSLAYYLPLVAEFMVGFNVAYAGLETNEAEPPLSELYLVGGPGTLRGYRNDQYAARRRLLVTAEPRYRFEQGYLFIFYDMAYLSLEAESSESKNVFSGFGFGLALRNEASSLKLSTGWQPGGPFDQPRLSVELSRNL